MKTLVEAKACVILPCWYSQSCHQLSVSLLVCVNSCGHKRSTEKLIHTIYMWHILAMPCRHWWPSRMWAELCRQLVSDVSWIINTGGELSAGLWQTFLQDHFKCWGLYYCVCSCTLCNVNDFCSVFLANCFSFLGVSLRQDKGQPVLNMQIF